MAWSVVQSASGTASSGLTLSVGFSTANVSSGNKIIAVVAFSCNSAGDTVSTVKDGAGNSWTQLATLNHSGTGRTVASIFALDVPSGDVGTKPTLTVTCTGTSFGISMVIQEVSGLLAGNTSAMIDGSVANLSGNGGSSTGTPTYSSSVANEYLITTYCDDGAPTTVTAPTGYTKDTHSINSNSIADCLIAYKNSTGGSETGSWALSGTAAWVDFMIAFKLASGGGTTFPVSLAVTTTTTSKLAKQIVKKLAVTTTTAPKLVKQIGKRLAVTTTTSVHLQEVKLKVVHLTVTTTTSVKLQKKIGKVLSVATTTTKGLVKSIRHSLAVATTTTKALLKRIGATLTVTTTTSDHLGTIKVHVVSLSVATTTTKALVKNNVKRFPIATHTVPGLKTQGGQPPAPPGPARFWIGNEVAKVTGQSATLYVGGPVSAPKGQSVDLPTGKPVSNPHG